MSTTTSFTLIPDVKQQIEPPEDGILSRTIFQDETVKVVLFGLAADQEISEHTSHSPVILHFIKGEATLKMGEQIFTAHAGTWVHMPARLPHAIHAKTPVVMELLQLQS